MTPVETILAALPEQRWAEATRRLKLVPELWEVAHEPDVLQAWLTSAASDFEGTWRPGRLAMIAFGAHNNRKVRVCLFSGFDLIKNVI